MNRSEAAEHRFARDATSVSTLRDDTFGVGLARCLGRGRLAPLKLVVVRHLNRYATPESLSNRNRYMN